MKLFSHRSQAGDTIVEVLISIGVVSLVLVGAFVVSNNSTKGVQDNHEHTEAQQHLQSEIESLRLMTKLELDPLESGGSVKYCRDAGDNYIPASNPENCAPVPIGGANGILTMTKSDNIYTFQVVWDSIKGGQASEEFVYKYYAS